jgi:integrase
VRWKIVPENVAKAVPNPQPKRPEIRPFESWEEVEAVADELGPWAPVAIVAAGAALRPEELLALEWRDIDRKASDLRHTYATMSLAAGVSLFALSRHMGTSLEMIDQTYGHLAPDAEAAERALLNAYDARAEEGVASRRGPTGARTTR